MELQEESVQLNQDILSVREVDQRARYDHREKQHNYRVALESQLKLGEEKKEKEMELTRKEDEVVRIERENYNRMLQQELAKSRARR
jgi:uncharacterized membrane protein